MTAKIFVKAAQNAKAKGINHADKIPGRSVKPEKEKLDPTTEESNLLFDKTVKILISSQLIVTLFTVLNYFQTKAVITSKQ